MGAMIGFIWIVMLWPLASIGLIALGLMMSYHIFFMEPGLEGVMISICIMLAAGILVELVVLVSIPAGFLILGVRTSMFIWVWQIVAPVLGLLAYAVYAYSTLKLWITGVVLLVLAVDAFRRLGRWMWKHHKEDAEYYKIHDPELYQKYYAKYYDTSVGEKPPST
jgi:hypothetical protein